MNSATLIEVLNRLLEAELTAIEYYRIHAEAIPEEEIAEGVRAIIPAEYSHALNLSRRILDLGGVPVQPGGEATREGREIGERSRDLGTTAMLKLELEREQQGIKDYAAPIADIEDDFITLEMLEEQLFDEMRHAKWLKQKIQEIRQDT